MKKVFAFVLALMLCVSMLSVTAMAADSAYLYVTSAEANAGSQVTLAVGLGGNTGVGAMDISFAYDNSILELVSIQGIPFGGGVWTIGSHAIWDAGSNSEYNGNILTLTFNVKETAQPGDKATVSVSCVAGKWNETGYEAISIGGSAGTVTIVCDHVWGNGVVTKEHTCTENGEMTYTCTKCGETRTEVIPAAHTWERTWSYTPDEHFHACAKCDATADNDIHHMNIVDAQAPEGDKNGYYLWDCDVCDYQWRETWYPDEEPKVGDIRPMMALGAFAVLFTMAAAAYVFKRKVNF